MNYYIVYKIFLRFVKEKIGEGTIPIYIQSLIKHLKNIKYQSWLNNTIFFWDLSKKNKAFWYKINYEWVSILSEIDIQNINTYISYKNYFQERYNNEIAHKQRISY